MGDNFLSSGKAKAAVTIGFILAYFKTAEAMVAFAPRGIFGMRSDWVGFIWAYLAALLVEGVAILCIYVLMDPNKDAKTRAAAGWVGALAVVYSAAMNIIDQGITDGTWAIADSSPFAWLLHAAIMLTPLIVAVTIAIMAIIDAQVPDRGRAFRPQGRGPERRPIVGGFDINKEREVMLAEVGGGQMDPSLLGAAPPNSNGRKFTSEVERGPKLALME